MNLDGVKIHVAVLGRLNYKSYSYIYVIEFGSLYHKENMFYMHHLYCFYHYVLTKDPMNAGDQYLRPYVISKPEVTVTKRTSKDEFLILASDGLWDVISSELACQVVRRCFSGQIRRISADEGGIQSRAAEAAALLAQLAMAKGSRDNTSVIVVELNDQNNL